MFTAVVCIQIIIFVSRKRQSCSS